MVSDGADTMNGDAGFDIVLYQGTNAANILSLSQAGTIITVAGVNAGTIDITAAPTVERVDVIGLQGNDAISLVNLTLESRAEGGDGNDLFAVRERRVCCSSVVKGMTLSSARVAPIGSKVAPATTLWSVALATTLPTVVLARIHSSGIRVTRTISSRGTKAMTSCRSPAPLGPDNYTVFKDNGRVIFQRVQGNVGINMGGVETILANSETIQLTGRNEVQPNTTTSGGFANFTYNAATGTFDVRILVTGLAIGDILDSHIHVGIAGADGPVVVPFGGGAGYVAVPGGFEFTGSGFVAGEYCSTRRTDAVRRAHGDFARTRIFQCPLARVPRGAKSAELSVSAVPLPAAAAPIR